MTQTKRTRYKVIDGKPVKQSTLYLHPFLPGETDDQCAERITRYYLERFGLRDGIDIEPGEVHNGRRWAYVTVEAR